ncbi:lisH domain-containing protein 05-like [Capsicum chacoense]
MDSDQESERRRDSDATSDENETGSCKSSEYSHSTSSSSSGSSSGDYIQVDPKIIFNSVTSGLASSKSHSNAKLRSQSVTRHQLKESSKTSTSSTSQVSDVTHESSFSTMSQSPSIQVMDREAGFDPNRIPSSLFGSKDSSSKEWSTASHESLFSIHTAGNDSPARDDIVMTNGDFKRSRKRDNYAEVDKNEKYNKSGELSKFRQTLPITKGGEYKKKIFEKERKVDVVNKPSATGSSDEVTKRIVHFTEEIKPGENRNRSTAIGCSDGNVCFRDSCSVVHPSDENGSFFASPM